MENLLSKYKINLPDFIILIGRLLNGHHIKNDDLITFLLGRLFIMSGGYKHGTF